MSYTKNKCSTLFIFRRDLRVQDNIGLAHALHESESVIPCFIFDPRQVDLDNIYRSDNAVQFMVDSLVDLAEQLKNYNAKLFFFYGKPEEVVEKLLNEKVAHAVYTNRDYTPFSIQRDKAIEERCLWHKAAFRQFDDSLLHAPEQVMSVSGTPYAMFTPFFKKAAQMVVAEPDSILKKKNSWFIGALSDTMQLHTIATQVVPHKNKSIYVQGGTQEAKKIIKTIPAFADYAQTRDYPLLPTTGLAAHLKFGTVSIRVVYHAIKQALGAGHPLLRQLFWRDFFTHVAYHSPFVFGKAYKEKYNELWWSNNKEYFERWCSGTTGFPIVDAGMRQMNETGFMHNRVRMIVGSFLVKDLHIDWRIGERYFATKLVDYDPAVNNGNWQWVASTGCDSQPYFRIFNPWLQQKKFDSGAYYIKRWVPELQDINPTIIHRWNLMHTKIKHSYVSPIIDHARESKLAKELYKRIAKL